MMMPSRKNIVSLSATLMLALTLAVFISFTSGTAHAAEEGAGISTADVPRAIPPQVVDKKIAVLYRAESVGTVFMLGLIFGMVSGVGLFFLYLRRQQARHVRHDPSDYLFEDWPNRPARGLREGSFGNGNGNRQSPPPSPATEDFCGDGNDEMIEQPEPWERSVDWWKGDPED